MEKQKMKPSAFDGKQEATTVVCKWDNVYLKDEDTNECNSPVFGTKKTQFYLSGEFFNDGTDDEADVVVHRNIDNPIWIFNLNIATSSVKKKVFIYSLFAKSNEKPYVSNCDNKGMSKN